MFTLPIINVKADPLDALLAAIGLRLSMLAKGDDEMFAELIKDRQVTLQLGSQAAGVARYYRFDNGRFQQASGTAADADLTIDFNDSGTGVQLLTQGNAAAFMTAIQDGKLTMQGDYSLLMWFNQLAKHLVPKLPEQLQPYLQQAQPYLQQVKPHIYKAQQFAKHWIGVAKYKLGK